MGDLLQSFAVLCAGAVIWLAKKMSWSSYWQLADPCCTVIFACLVLWSSIGVMKSIAHVLLEGAPEGMDAAEIFAVLRRELRPKENGGVRKVSHLHLW